MTDYNRDVLEQYALEQIEYLREQGADYFNQLLRDQEIHHVVFNEDYYIIYHGDAIEWMGSHSWGCIERVKEYEQFNFGEGTTDLSSPMHVVNMYAYIVGEEIIYDLIVNGTIQPMEEEEVEEEEEEVEPEEITTGEFWVRAELSAGEWGEVELKGREIKEYRTRGTNETETDFNNRKEAIIKKAVEDQEGAGGASV